MVKNKQKSKNNNQKKQKRKVYRVTYGVDPTSMRKYVELLNDPCTGPLVHAPGSTAGGMITRFEADYIVGEGAGITAGFMAFTPGAINNASGTSHPGNGYIGAVATSDSVGTTTFINSPGFYVPGYTYLQTNASSYRCIAMCVQMYWPGSELNRAGIISACQATYGTFKQDTAGSGPSVATYRSLSPVVERMPTDHFEAKWAPSFTDGLFRNPLSPQEPEAGHTSLLVTWGGLPAATGVRLRVVAVYEWNPKAVGLTINSNTSQTGAGGMQDARQLLDKSNAAWWYHTGQAAMNFASGAVVAYASMRRNNFPLLRN